ncbi:LLM class flavin-dependent oxidoreductase [Streptomyces sp. SCSIO 30461]|uniref:LLM class flavin-dependent oxidoreductase n=1 Tax=Streptomyces sp. SCSIO 30461 TaxID=3118085 RepID=UPI0030CDEAF5
MPELLTPMPELKTPHVPLLFAALPAVHPARDNVPWQRPLTEAAVAAEHAGIDALVVERGAGLQEPVLDPVVVLAGLAPRTYRLGLVAEVPSSSGEPERLAGELASLDTISGGRAGWLVPEPEGQFVPASDGQLGAESDGQFGPKHGPAEAFIDEVGEHWKGRRPLVLTSWPPSPSATRQADGTVGPPAPSGLALKTFTVALEPGEAVAQRLEAALADGRTDGLLLRFPGGSAGLLRFAHETVPMLRDRALLPERTASPRQLWARLGLERPIAAPHGPAA